MRSAGAGGWGCHEDLNFHPVQGLLAGPATTLKLDSVAVTKSPYALIPFLPPTHSLTWVRSDQIRSVTQLCLTLCDPMDCNTPGSPVYHQLPELAQTHVHRLCDAIQPSHPLLSPSPPAFNLSQHQGLFQGVSSLHQVAKVLECVKKTHWDVCVFFF